MSSELRQIQHSLLRPQNVIATQQALYAALHRAKDTVIITDDALRIQYMNKQTERILGMKIVSKIYLGPWRKLKLLIKNVRLSVG